MNYELYEVQSTEAIARVEVGSVASRPNGNCVSRAPSSSPPSAPLLMKGFLIGASSVALLAAGWLVGVSQSESKIDELTVRNRTVESKRLAVLQCVKQLEN
ncbi:MAG: hypothetical protein F6J93_03565 [Oscillatoria sp. SIO1A7]|nr:hypothetical protein [Oscillatoria sp. SIO1A7]